MKMPCADERVSRVSTAERPMKIDSRMLIMRMYRANLSASAMSSVEDDTLGGAAAGTAACAQDGSAIGFHEGEGVDDNCPLLAGGVQQR